MVRASFFVPSGMLLQAKGQESSTTLTFFSHLYSSNKFAINNCLTAQREVVGIDEFLSFVSLETLSKTTYEDSPDDKDLELFWLPVPDPPPPHEIKLKMKIAHSKEW